MASRLVTTGNQFHARSFLILLFTPPSFHLFAFTILPQDLKLMPRTELEIIKDLYQLDPSKIHFACVSHHNHRDALARSLAELLGDRALESVPLVSSLAQGFTSELSKEQQQIVSLCKDVSDVLRSVLLRLNNLYQQANDPADGRKPHSCVLDRSAIARANQELSEILKFYTRKLSSTNQLLHRLKQVIKFAKQNSDSMLDNSGVLIMSLEVS